MKKQPYLQYDQGYIKDKSFGALHIYLPTSDGYIDYVIAHSLDPEIFCDTWRLATALSVDDELEVRRELNPRAEWDMAIFIEGRDDFIGGLLHGDEKCFDMSVSADGCELDPSDIIELYPFTELSVSVSSVGLDPEDHRTKVLLHKKDYTATAEGIETAQTVEWLGDYKLGTSYMAMMPPYKELTDIYFTDVDPARKRIDSSSFNIVGARSATLLGEDSGYSFTMSVSGYPDYAGADRLNVRDNGGRPYNKMYFPVCAYAEVKRGDEWNTVTRYRIEKR